MSPQVNEAIRTAFEEIADSATPPSGLADAALRQGQRRRIARRSVVGGLATALAALVAVVGGYGLPLGDAGEQVAGERPGPMVVTAYSGLRDVTVEDPSPAFNYSLLLNRQTGEYERVAYKSAVPSPDESKVLVTTGDNSVRYPARIGVLDRASGDVRWLPDSGPTYSHFLGYAIGRWSPDGRRLLFTHTPKNDKAGFMVVDAETMSVRHVELPEVATQDNQGIGLVWAADDEIALTLSTIVDQKSVHVTAIRFYDLDGKIRRTVPATAALLPVSVRHPGGRWMALADDFPSATPAPILIADRTTGAVEATVVLNRPFQLLGWHDDQQLLVHLYGDIGAGKPDELGVVDLTGQVTGTMRLPMDVGNGVEGIHVGSSTGLPSKAAKITF